MTREYTFSCPVGEHLRAARYAWVAAKLGEQGRLSGEVWSDCIYRVVDLLVLLPEVQRAEDDAVGPFEVLVLNTAVRVTSNG